MLKRENNCKKKNIARGPCLFNGPDGEFRLFYGSGTWVGLHAWSV